MTIDIKTEMLEKVHSMKGDRRGILDDYRDVLVEMKKRYFTQQQMATVFCNAGIQISQQAISAYLKKHPLDNQELNNSARNAPSSKQSQTKEKSKTKSQNKVIFDLNKPF